MIREIQTEIISMEVRSRSSREGGRKKQKKMPKAVAVAGLALLFGVVSSAHISDIKYYREQNPGVE